MGSRCAASLLPLWCVGASWFWAGCHFVIPYDHKTIEWGAGLAVTPRLTGPGYRVFLTGGFVQSLAVDGQVLTSPGHYDVFVASFED